MTLCTLVTGGTGAGREAAIFALIDPSAPTTVIFEGLSAGTAPVAARALFPLLQVSTIAAGCPCCDTGLVMRVTLDRMLRRPPARLFIGIADPAHLPHLQQFLGAAPYSLLLTLTAPMICAA